MSVITNAVLLRELAHLAVRYSRPGFAPLCWPAARELVHLGWAYETDEGGFLPSRAGIRAYNRHARPKPRGKAP